MKLLKVTLPSNIEIRTSISAETDSVMADPTQIHQVLMNLCTNAAYAMRENGGLLTVVLKEVAIHIHEAGNKELKPGNYLQLSVSDTGHGILPENMDKIFEPYFTTKGPGKGTGLGLSVTRNILKKLSGAITVESAPGKGARFTVMFPCADEPVDEGVMPLAVILPTGHERILFVDDEEFLVDIGKELLEQLGYRALAMTSSTEALDVFWADPAQFDLVITDYSMPKMTGIELIQKLRAIRPDIPVILCSGFPETIPLEKMKALGIQELMIKPFTINELALRIRHVFNPAS